MPIRLRSIDRHFARFCRTGDAEALGRVFDASARELLHIAAWLLGNRADAEDLLQRTFLTAIEDRASFARKRRVMPWLTGILTNHARNLRRERARRAALPVRPEPISDPVAEASDAEFAEWLRAARDQVGPPYAEVLALHLEHGLNAKEIAERLGRPAGTVRTQLMRALELLRKRLPGGFAAAIAPMPADPGVLAAMKQSVLAAARQAVPTATAAVATVTLVTGGLLMSKKAAFLVAAALLLLAVGVFVAWPEHAGNQPADTLASPAIAALETKASAAPAPPADSHPLARSATTSPDADPGFGSLRVVVRWRHDGSPAAGVGITAHQSHFYSLRRDGVTDLDGVCILRHLSPARWFAICTHAADQSVAADVSANAQCSVEVTAERQAMVRGTVLDEAGTSVEGARIWISDGRGPDERQFTVARSDTHGWFVLPVRGMQLVGARKAGLIQALAVPVDGAKGDREITLRMGGLAAAVHGTVRDAQGQPIAWARVEMGPNGQMWRVVEATPDLEQAYGPQVLTGPDGRFAFDDVDPAPKVVSPILFAWAEGCAPWRGVPEVHAGTDTEVHICLEPEAIVEGTVRDAAGAAVADAIISLGQAISYRFWHVSPSTRSDAAGHFLLRDLPAGPVPLLAKAAEKLAAADLQLTAGQRAEWNPVLGSGRTIRGIVFGPDGTPMARLTLGFLDWNIGSDRRTTTDGSGRFTLENVGDAPIAIELGGILQDQLRIVENVPPDTDNLEIRLTHADLPTARVRGRLVDEHGNGLGATIELASGRYTNRVHSVRTDDTGAFDFGPLRPGRRQLQITTRERGHLPVDPVDLEPDQTRDLGTITVPRPGSLTVTMTGRDGAPVPRARLCLYSSLQGDPQSVGGVQIKDGKGRADVLPPGHWFLITDHHGTGPAEFEIRSDQDTHVELRPK